MADTLLGFLHRLSHFILTATLSSRCYDCYYSNFTDKEPDVVQILLMCLNHLLGIRTHTFTLIIPFFFPLKSHLLNTHCVCQHGKYCYSYNKPSWRWWVEIVQGYSVHSGSSWLCLQTGCMRNSVLQASQWPIRISTLGKISGMWHKQHW